MGIASGAFIGPSPHRQMASAQSAELPHTQGLVGELRQGVPSAYMTIALLFALVAVAWGLHRSGRRRRSGDAP